MSDSQSNTARIEDPRLEETDFHDLITGSGQMFELFDKITRVARHDTPTIVRGESGTGKELVARALHRLSRRARAPFHAVNCATLRPDLAASTLFGHARGAFTGAVSNHVGLFERADGGTLFLDEIVELPLDVQAQLLRVLQERTFVPVGGTRQLSVDVRLITATHQSLREAVAAKKFREDLMYRLRVVPLYLPPLVERGGDVELLTWYFVRRNNAMMGKKITRITEPAMKRLEGYHWPGNVRELSNAIEHAFIMSDGDTLTLENFAPEIRGEAPRRRREPELTVEEAERLNILRALEENTSRAEAAKRLGISRTTLWRKIRELGLDD